MALGWAYVEYGGLQWMQAVFYGVGAAVIGIIAISAQKLTKKSVGRDKLLWAIYLSLAAVTVVTESEIAWLFIAAGILAWLVRCPPKAWFGGGLVAGLPGSVVAAAATFLPCYLFTVIPAPYFKKYGKRPGIVAFVDGITAAAIGAITGSVIVIAKRSIVDLPTALLAVAAAALLWKFKKLPEPLIVVGAALIGLLLFPLMR